MTLKNSPTTNSFAAGFNSFIAWLLSAASLPGAFNQKFLKCSFICLLLLPSLSANAQRAAKSYDIKNVKEVVAGGGARLQLTQGSIESLRAEADKTVIDRATVDLTGDRLTLGVKHKLSGISGFFNWAKQSNEEITFILTVKNLEYLETNGAVQAYIGDFNGGKIKIISSGASELNFGALKLDDLFLELSGASNARVQQFSVKKSAFELSGAANFEMKNSGQTGSMFVGASGASNFHGKSLRATQAKVEASGASNVDVNVTESLDANASGASTINYLGQAKVRSDSSGASHINAIGN